MSEFERACRVLVGGVNSPVRAFKGVGGSPIVFARGEGPWIISTEGQRYLDFVGSWGPLIAGHAHPRVISAICETAAKGTSFGATCLQEILLAEKVIERVPGVERVRFVNSGTEATMSAVRLARAVTGRSKIIKFTGGYHGHADSLLVSAGSGPLTLGIPSSPGIPVEVAELTLSVRYNDLEALRRALTEYGEDVAAVIVEPVAGNMGCVPPVPGFLQGLIDEAHRVGALVIFDEVMTGFRVSPSGAQGLAGLRPDLTTFGKIIGGGLPTAAFGGKAEIMEQLAPVGPVYQAGTLSGNPLAMAAGLATLELTSEPGFYDRLEAATEKLALGIEDVAKHAGIPVVVNRVCGMFSVFFTSAKSVSSYEEVMQADTQLYAQYFHAMLTEGIYFAPSAYEAAFLNASQTKSEIDATIDAASRVFNQLG